MPHRLLQAVWQAQQALMQVGQIAEQLLREQEQRNAWTHHAMNQQLYQNTYETVYPIVPQGNQQMTGQAGFTSGQMIHPAYPQTNVPYPQHINWNQEMNSHYYEPMGYSGIVGTKVEPVFEEMRMDEPIEEKLPPNKTTPRRKNNQQNT